MDNAAFHKSEKTRKIIEAAKCVLMFLPPYSPDLMPIEKTFGTLKQYRRFNVEVSLDDAILHYQ